MKVCVLCCVCVCVVCGQGRLTVSACWSSQGSPGKGEISGHSTFFSSSVTCAGCGCES